MKVVVIYPGRFQPFGIHHAKAYKFLTSMFGPEVYISTSNVTNLESPFTFNEKIDFIEKYVPISKIRQCKIPYQSEEIMNHFDKESTIVIFAYSSKDVGRISYTRADGSPGYLQPFTATANCQPFKNHGYVIVIPTFKVKFNGKDISGTLIRSLFRQWALDPINKDNRVAFKKLFGYYDKGLYIKTLMKFK